MLISSKPITIKSNSKRNKKFGKRLEYVNIAAKNIQPSKMKNKEHAFDITVNSSIQKISFSLRNNQIS